MATKEVITRMCASLHETKQSNFNVKFHVKHCILITTISARASSIRGMARVLKVHHCNVYITLMQQSLMCESRAACWRVSVQKKKDRWNYA
jgi:hypothetical protein